MILTYRYRVKDRRARKVLSEYARAVNFIWNFCVETQRESQRRWRLGSCGSWLSQYDFQALTKGASKELGLHAQTVQNVCAQFVVSRDTHHKFPRFRASAGPRRSLGWVPFQAQSRQVNGNSITYRGHRFRFFGAKRRPLPATAKGGCFAEDARGRWWVCFQVEIAPDHATGPGEIGIDLGLKHLAVTSDGEKIEALRCYRRWEEKLAVAQRAGNRQRVKAIHERIANSRKDHLHKESARLVRANQVIIVGDVNAAKLAKTRMAKSVLDAGWSMFRNMLRYKASRHGATYREVDESFTTQTCSACGMVPPRRPRGIAGLGIRVWRCSVCGTTHDRDVNAARNILALGRSAAPRVDESRRTLCQVIG